MKSEKRLPNVFYGDQNLPIPSHMNYGALFLNTILRFGNKTALTNGSTDEQITFRELAQKIVNTASSLTRLGVKRGEVVAICSENRIEFIITVVAVFCIGATATFINSAYSKDEMIHTANISKPKYVFLSSDAAKIHYETLRDVNTIREFFMYGANVISETRAISFENLAKEFVDINSYKAENLYGEVNTALVVYSSGTTGLPKGVKLTHLNLIVTAFQEKSCYKGELSMLIVTPFCNAMGIFCVTDALIIGKEVLFLTRFNENIYLNTIDKHKPGILIAAPATVIVLTKSPLLKNYDVSSVKIIICGGAPLNPEVITVTKARFPSVKPGSVGKVSAGIILKIVDLETERTLGPNQQGEVRVKGPALFSGYTGNTSLNDDFDDQGFFKTGDVAYYDADGFFHIVDRIKELIKYKAWQSAVIPAVTMSAQDAMFGIHSGEQNFLIPSHMCYGKFLLDRILKGGDRIALIDGLTGVQLRYGEMAQQIVNLASSLMRLGVTRDEVVGICSENRAEFLITALAVWCMGATVTFLNSAYNKNEIMHTMKISRPKYMFISPENYKVFSEIVINLNIVDKFFMFGNSNNPNTIRYNDLLKSHVDVDKFKPFQDINGLSRTALILYSSGTTGLPKGVKLTHLNLITSSSQPSVSRKDLVCLIIAPFSNTVGIILSLDELFNRRTVVYLSKFKEDVYLNCIQKYKAGMLLVVPPLVVTFTKSTVIKNYDVSSVELMYSGGAPLDLAVIERAKRIFPNLRHILQGYGMTETTGGITEETDTYNKPGSVGKVALGNIIKIVDIENRKVLGPNEKGEICVKGPVLFAGYIGKDLKEDLDDEGFYKTGDIGYYDEEGYFFIVDRLKELIKYKAGQVAPSELEAILIQHPAVKDVGVAGKPDPLVGELPTAFVTKKPGAVVTEQELIDYVDPKVSSWKKLRGGVYFVSEIPKTASGKILRRVLRESLKKPISKL